MANVLDFVEPGQEVNVMQAPRIIKQQTKQEFETGWSVCHYKQSKS